MDDSDRNAPATRGDVKDLESGFEGKLDACEQRMLDAVQKMINDSETRLLSAFYNYAQ